MDLQTGEGVFEKGDEVCSKVHDFCSLYPHADFGKTKRAKSNESTR